MLLLAIVLPVLAMFAGLAIDVGRAESAHTELSIGVDAAALAAARAALDPDPTEAKLRMSAAQVAARTVVYGTDGSGARGSPITLDANANNAANGDIVLGSYDFGAGTFTPAPTPIVIPGVNAVKITARLAAAAGQLSATFGRLTGFEAFDFQVAAVAVLGGPSNRQVDFPMAVDPAFFAGIPRSLNPPPTITLSASTTNVMWTGFTSGADDHTVRNFIDFPHTVPTLHTGDHVSLNNGVMTDAYHATVAHYPLGSVITFPIVSTFGPDVGTVHGFGAMQIAAISSSGSDKYLQGSLVAMSTTLSGGATSNLATCFGLDCRAFLVQ